MKNSILVFVAAIATISFLSGCFIKVPNDQDILGGPVSYNDVRQALETALTVDDPDSLFRVGDTGTTVVIDTVLTSQNVYPPRDLQITSIDSNYYYYTETYLGATTAYKLPRYKSAPQVSSMKTLIKWVGFKLQNIYSSVTVEFSRAVGDEEVLERKPIFKQHPLPFLDRSLNLKLVHLLRDESKRQQRQLQSLDLTTVSTAASSPTPDPTPTPDMCNTPASKYYGLKVLSHDLPVRNCGQIPSCKVKATRIEYNEMCHIGNTDRQIHWSWDLSNEVPGLFSVMEQCFTTMTNNQGDSQLPLTECNRVYDFKFGSN